MAGQLIKKSDDYWLLRIFKGRDPLTKKRFYKAVKFNGNRDQARAELEKLVRQQAEESAVRSSQVTVPNVVGQDYRKGEAMLKEKGLGMKVLAKRSDQNQPVDIILDQVPRGGQSVDLGYTVGVMIGGVSAEKGGPER